MDHSKAIESYSCSNPFAANFHPEVLAAIFRRAKWSNPGFPLRVHFINSLENFTPQWQYGGKPITTKTIINWSNEWCPSQKLFRNEKNSQKAVIRVLFQEDKPSECKLGAYATEVYSPKPTMWLNLTAAFTPGDNNKKHTVIHEFGHALGLIHEHARKDLWEVIKPYLDERKISEYHIGHNLVNHMAGDPDAAHDHYFDHDPLTEYDSGSIMHYPWAANGLLKEGYRTKKEVDDKYEEGGMTDTQHSYLIEVVTGPSRVITPSSKDKEGLRKAYDLPAIVSMEVEFCLDSGVLVFDEPSEGITYRDVYVCGSFNDWEKNFQMLPNILGKLTATVNLPLGKHQYKFFVDGKWCYHSDMPFVHNDKGTYNNEVNVTQKHIDALNDEQTLTDGECPPRSVVWF